MVPRTGRPVSGNARQKREVVRMSDEELEKLEYCARTTGKTKAEIIREGIEETYQKLKRGDEHNG